MQARFQIQVGSRAGIIADALQPEMEVTERTHVKILAEGDGLVIDILAEDVVALRAAINSYLRWTKLAIDSEDAIGAE